MIQKPRPVFQKDKEGNILNTYKSISQASLKTGASEPNICSCCKKRIKTAKGFIWEYVSPKQAA